MIKKIGSIIINFIRSMKFYEFIEVFCIPIFLIFMIYYFIDWRIIDFYKFANSFNDTVVSVAALLSAFGTAAVSMLISSSNTNIVLADDYLTDRVDNNNKRVSLYKLQILRNFFSLLVEVILLCVSIMFKLILQINLMIIIKVIFYIEMLVLMISIFSQLITIVGLYYLFVTIKNKSDYTK